MEFLNGDAGEIFDEIYRALQIYPGSIKNEVGLKKWREMAAALMDFLDENPDAFYTFLERRCEGVS